MYKDILVKMGFPEKWEQIGRIKKYTKSELLINKKPHPASDI